MNIPILNQDDDLLHPADVALLYRRKNGRTVMVNASPSETHAFARKIASNRGWQTRNYSVNDVVLLPPEIAQAMLDALIAASKMGCAEATAILDKMKDDAEEPDHEQGLDGCAEDGADRLSKDDEPPLAGNPPVRHG